MRKTVLLLVVLSLLPAAIPPLQASEVSGLYQAGVPVADQGSATRRMAVRRALADVLVRVSGSRQVLENPQALELLENAMQYVSQYNYQALPVEPEAETTAAAAAFPQQLDVVFDEEGINQALRERSIPIWGKARPVTLMWLAVEDSGQRQLLGADTLPQRRTMLETAAGERGVPLIFPLLDLEDQVALRFTDVWGNFQEPILRASGRYQPGAILVGRLYHASSAQWQARWSFYLDGDWQQWMSSGERQQDVLAAGVDGAADVLAARFASHGGTQQGFVEVVVDNVDTLAGYARAMKYLAGLDPVSDVQVHDVDGARVTFYLTIHGDRSAFEQAIVFGETLAPQQAAEVRMGDAVGLEYRLLP